VVTPDEQRALGAVARRRHRMTPALLERVANAWLDGGPKGGPTRVAEALHVSRRQADRYVAAARKEGLIA